MHEVEWEDAGKILEKPLGKTKESQVLTGDVS